MTDRTRRITVLSAVTKHLCSFLLIALPLGLAAFWLVFAEPDPARFGPGFAMGPDTPLERGLGLGLSLIPLAIALFALVNLRRLFSFYAAGVYFTPATVRCFTNMAWTLVAATPAGILTGAALSVALSYDNPAGQRELAISLSSAQLTMLLTGIVLLVISWVMADAVRLQEENAAFV